MDSDVATNLINRFSERLINFILRNRRYPLIPPANYGENLPEIMFEDSVGIVIIAMIKGELKEYVQKTAGKILRRMRDRISMHEVLRNCRRNFLETNPFDFDNILKAMAVSIMFPFCCEDTPAASLWALEEIKHMFQSLDDGHFVRSSGLSDLSDFANNKLLENENLQRIYEKEIYPW